MNHSPPPNKYTQAQFQTVTSGDDWHQAMLALSEPHPLQSWQWGQFRQRWGWSAHPLLLNQDPEGSSTSPAAALILQRSLPSLPYTILYVPKGPLLNYQDQQLIEVILERLEEIARQKKAIFIKIDPDVVQSWGEEGSEKAPAGEALLQILQGRGWRFSKEQIQFRNTVELDLTLSEEALLGAMKQKTRYNIRLAGRKDVVVRPGTSEDFQIIANMYMETAARDSFATRPVAYYLDAWQTFYDAGMAQPFIAEFEGQPLAAVILVHFGQKAIYMYGASTNIERRRMPNHLLQWEAIRWSKAQGYKVYDFWGAPDEFVESDPLWGVWRFKAGFNGRVVRHIGAWDFIARPFWFWIYATVMPRYINFLRARNNQSLST